jgi:hypothetical protein
VSSITVSGTVHTPDASNKVSPTTDILSTALTHWHSRPRMRRSAANGDVVILLPSVVTSVTIGGTIYTPNASNEITVPAAAATTFLEGFKYLP